jgi:hypothetical protein
MFFHPSLRLGTETDRWAAMPPRLASRDSTTPSGVRPQPVKSAPTQMARGFTSMVVKLENAEKVGEKIGNTEAEIECRAFC